MKRNLRLSRRTLLRGAGASLALPFLNIMEAPTSTARAATAAPKRWVMWHFPTGVRQDEWAVAGDGDGEKDWAVSSTLEPLADLGIKDDVSVIQGTSASNYARGIAASHTCGLSAQLTGFSCPEEDARNLRSIDQGIAAKISGDSPVQSLQLGTRVLHENPNDEPGYSSVIKDHLSWKDELTPLPKETDPGRVFQRLFGDVVGDVDQSELELQRRQRLRRSILDSVLEEGKHLKTQLGEADARKVEQYLSNIRDIEKSIQTAPRDNASGICDAQGRVGSFRAPDDIEDHVKQMNRLMLLALQCDITRVIVFQYETTVTPIRHPFLGVSAPYHLGCAHHNSDLGKLRDYAKVNKWLVSQFGDFVASLKQSEEADGSSILDNSAVIMTSELGDGSSHSHVDLPCLLAGSAGGSLEPGRHLWQQGEEFMKVLIGTAQAVGADISEWGVDYTERVGTKIEGALPGLLT